MHQPIPITKLEDSATSNPTPDSNDDDLLGIIESAAELEAERCVLDRYVTKDSWYVFDEDGFLYHADRTEKGAWRAGRSGYVEGNTADTAFIRTPCTCGADKIKSPFHYEWCEKREE